MAAGRFRQLGLLLWKNWLFSIRGWKSTLLQLLAPCFFLVLATGLSYLPQGLENDPNPSAELIGKLPRCQSWNGLDCTSLVVIIPRGLFNTTLIDNTTINFDDHVRDSCVDTMLTDFSEVTGLEMGKDIVNVSVNFSSVSLLNVIGELKQQFSYNRTQVGLLFLGCSFDKPEFNYTIIYNSSRALKIAQLIFGSPNKPDGRVELAILLDQIFMKHSLNKSSMNVAVKASTFPRFYQQQSIAAKQAASATFFIFCAITIQFVMLLYNVVSEKDLKLRQGLKLVGLKDSVYWGSWAITGIIIAFLSTCVLMVTGYACKLQFFLNTNFFINFILFLIYSISMVPLGFFTSVFISTVRAAVNSGMVIFVVGLMIISLLGNPFLMTQLYEHVLSLVYVLSFLPPFHLAKIMSDIGEASSATDMNGLLNKNKHFFSWHELFRNRSVISFDIGGDDGNTTGFHYVKMPASYLSLVGLTWNAVLYGVLSWYLDSVLRGNHGIPRKWYFCFQPSYWLDWLPQFSSKTKFSNIRAPSDPVQVTDTEDETDVEDSTALLHGGRGHSGHALRIDQLKKTFLDRCSCSKKMVKPAVDGLTMCAEEHQILALLGHNGAGKTTTINMLIGLLEPDMGDAYFYGLSVREELDVIRSILGVCPQHDVLWDDLTAIEHMKLFGYLKDIPSQEMENEIATLLKEVQLDKVAKNRVKTFSGGMKRRLSVALSFLGNPKVMFLDEPTTGMDPKIRRDIWNLILRLKENRVIIMTTHSMEEADILGDNIAIMANGQLKVMGTSVNLKNRFAGYKVELIVKYDDVIHMMDLVREKLPGAIQKSEPIDVEGGGVLLPYALAPDRHDEVVPFFEVIEKNESVASMVLDYSISQTTLEEVFLNVTVNELFQDVTYVPALMRSSSYTVSSPSFPEVTSASSHNVINS